ncbi:MAG: nucleotide exchange factor GrpE [Planctomycetota bacterium]
MNGQEEQYEEPTEQDFIEDDEQQPEDVDIPMTDAEADPAAEIERLQAELAAFREKFARVQADFQNANRRMERDNAQRLGIAVGAFVKELLPVIDNLERALQVDPDAPASQVLGGVQATLDSFLQTLGKQQVERIAPEPGTPFDHNEHEALMQQPTDEYDEPTVTQLLQAGYRHAGRTIRPAQVAVSSVS